MSNTAGEELSIERFVNIVKPLVKMPASELKSHVYGILFGMACCLKGIHLDPEQTSVKLLAMPDRFKEHVERQVTGMMKVPQYANGLDQIRRIC